MHPTDPRSDRVVVKTYGNLKQAPCDCRRRLPVLQDHVFASNAHDKRRLSRSTFSVHYFVHIPKTGGTALKRCLGTKADPLNSLRDPPQNLLLKGVDVKSRPASGQPSNPRYVRVLSRGHLSASAVDPRMHTFAILREPYARIRSAFRFVLGGGDGSEVWGERNGVIRQLQHTLQSNQIQRISDIFDRPASDPVRKHILDHSHFRPMVDFVCAPTSAPSRPSTSAHRPRVLVDKLFVLETLQPEQVAAYLGIPTFEMERKNASHVPYTLSAVDKRCIRKHYAADFELYEEAMKGSTSKSA